MAGWPHPVAGVPDRSGVEARTLGGAVTAR
jgi:hypothetical protein